MTERVRFTRPRWLEHDGIRLVLVLSVAALVGALFAARGVLTRPVVTDSDFAANGILIRRAQVEPLWHGHYSRFGFHHPGPWLLWISSAAEMVAWAAFGIVGSAYGAHVLGSAVLVAVVVGVVAWVFVPLVGRMGAAGLGLLVLGAGELVVAEASNGFRVSATSIWPPSQVLYLFAAFLCLMVAAALGAPRAVIPVFVTGALVAQAYVTAVPVVTVVALAGMVAAVLVNRAGWSIGPPDRRQVLRGSAVAGAVVAPAVLRLAFDDSGDAASYVRTSLDRPGFVPRSPAEVLRFVVSDWWRGPVVPALVLLSLGVVAVALRLGRVDRRARALLAGFAVASALVAMLSLLIAWRSIDSLRSPYVLWFTLVAPVVGVGAMGVIAATGLVAGGRAKHGRRWVIGSRTALVAVGAVAAFVGWGAARTTYGGSPTVEALVESAPGGPVSLYFESADWPVAVGMLAELDRRGAAVCTPMRDFELIVTPRLLCADGDDRPRFGVASGEARGRIPVGAQMVRDVGGVAFYRAP